MKQAPQIDPYELEYRFVRLRNRMFCQLSPKDSPDARKIFVLGHPHTATISIHKMLKAKGISAIHSSGHWRTWRGQAFSDRGHYQPFDLFDRYYPNSTFVLNTRPSAHYLTSLLRHSFKGAKPKPKLSVNRLADEILRRNAYFTQCVQYFLKREDLIVANVERRGALKFIAQSLGLPNDYEPWSNYKHKTELTPELVERVDKAYTELGVANETDNPFVIRSLLSRNEQASLDQFLTTNRDRIFL